MRRRGFACGLIALALLLVWVLRAARVERSETPLSPSRAGTAPEPAVAVDGELRAPSTRPAEPEREEAARGLTVRVVDETGRAVAGALVRLARTPMEARTDARGRCQLEAGERRVLELEASAPGHIGRHDSFAPTAELTLRLPRCGALEGRVVVAPDGAETSPTQHIAGARVHLRCPDPQGFLLADVESDADGTFRFGCAPLVPELVACASAPGFPERGVGVPAAGHQLVIGLRPAPTVEVEVREWPAGTPIAGARVNEACTDGAGRVWLARDEHGLGFEAGAPGFLSLVGVLRLSELPAHGPLVLSLPRPAFLEGRVRAASGAALAGVELRFEAQEEATPSTLPRVSESWSWYLPDESGDLSDARGFYRSPPLWPGQPSVLVCASHPQAGDARASVGPLGPSGTTTTLDLVLTPRVSGAIAGHVRFRDQWISGSVRWRGAQRSGEADLDIEGDYRLEDVETGPVELEVHAGPEELAGLLRDARARVSVEAGATLRRDFDLSLPMAEIAGHVLHADGSAAVGVSYSVTHGDPPYDTTHKSKRGGSWSVLVPDLGWEYELDFRLGNESVRLAGVHAGDTKLEVVLPSLTYLGVLPVDAESGRPPAQWTLLWRRSGAGPFERVRTGRLELAPGLVDVRVEATDLGYEPAEVDGVRVELGVSNTVRLTLRRGLALELEFDPLPGHELYLCGPAGDGAPGSPLARRWISVDAFGMARLEGLTPGLWRLAADPDELRFEPEVIELPHDGRLAVRWTRRE